jgi:hypothetical protein
MFVEGVEPLSPFNEHSCMGIETSDSLGFVVKWGDTWSSGRLWVVLNASTHILPVPISHPLDSAAS